jgi:hypothetical protein
MRVSTDILHADFCLASITSFGFYPERGFLFLDSTPKKTQVQAEIRFALPALE